MTETECISLMKAPGDKRTGKPYWGCVIQIIVTSTCNLSCINCTQLSQLRRKPWFMSLEHFEQALLSLKGFYGTVGVFGGNCALHPQFSGLCELVRKHVPKDHAGVWCNNPMTPEKASEMRRTFSPTLSNLNVHLDADAYKLFKNHWPESNPFGLTGDSRHSPPWVAMKDVVKVKCDQCNGVGVRMDRVIDDEGLCPKCNGRGVLVDESRIHELISNCDINQFWSAAIGVFRGKLRAYFCEIAAAQAMLHQGDPDYPDTGLDPRVEYEHKTVPYPVGDRLETTVGKWWQLGMPAFQNQVRKHCFDCGVPLRGKGELSQSEDGAEQVSETHADLYKPKKKGRRVELVTLEPQLYRNGKVGRVIEYLQNGRK